MWFLLALLTALFTSLLDVFGKRIIHKVDVVVIAWGSMFFSLPFLGIYLLADGIPKVDAAFGGALAGSTVLLVVASLLYFKAIKYSDLSIAMPMLAFTPLFLLATSPVMLGEYPGKLGVIGIILIVCGAYVLRFTERHKGYWEPFKYLVREKGPRYMLTVALLYSIGANLDKIGVVHSSPVMWITALNTTTALGLGAIILRRNKGAASEIRREWLILIILGFVNAVALICQMTAIQMTIVPYLIAVKRTSVFMSALFGFFLFKEKGIHERMVGAILMIAGVTILVLGQ